MACFWLVFHQHHNPRGAWGKALSPAPTSFGQHQGLLYYFFFNISSCNDIKTPGKQKQKPNKTLHKTPETLRPASSRCKEKHCRLPKRGGRAPCCHTITCLPRIHTVPKIATNLSAVSAPPYPNSLESGHRGALPSGVGSVPLMGGSRLEAASHPSRRGHRGQSRGLKKKHKTPQSRG